jgi:hypothetical protein
MDVAGGATFDFVSATWTVTARFYVTLMSPIGQVGLRYEDGRCDRPPVRPAMIALRRVRR